MAKEHTFCRGCGINAWRFREGRRMVHEDFYVHDDLWDATCPDDGIFCIGCFEARLGRQLTPDDFKHPARAHMAPWPGWGTPPSARFIERSDGEDKLDYDLVR